MSFSPQVPRELSALMDRLSSRGFLSWLVGGCLRDVWRGALPHDWDVATTARPEEVLALFPSAVPTGLPHGTVTVPLGPLSAEVTTCRREGAYRDFRRPGSVAFTDRIEEDLARRDFTFNAMAWSPQEGLLDPFGGRDDLAARRVRCVGDPADRLGEDALRILRALRFAATLDFSLEAGLDRALRERAPLLRHVAAERLWGELARLLPGPGAQRALTAHGAVRELLLPGADPSGLSDRPEELVPRLAWLLRSLAPAGAGAALRCLRADGETRERVQAVLRRQYDGTEDLLRLLRAAGERAARDLLAFHGRDPAALDAALASGAPWRRSHLSVSGDDLLALGLPPGPDMGRLLERLLDDVMDGRCPNRKAELLRRAREGAGGA